MTKQPAEAPPMTAQPGPTPEKQSIRLVIGSVAVLLLLASLDQTIVSTALPTIVADLGGLDHLSWVVTAYILASTIAAPLYGKLGDLYGRRGMVFHLGRAVFAGVNAVRAGAIDGVFDCGAGLARAWAAAGCLCWRCR